MISSIRRFARCKSPVIYHYREASNSIFFRSFSSQHSPTTINTPEIPQPFETENYTRIEINSPIVKVNSFPFTSVINKVLSGQGLLAPTPSQAQCWRAALKQRDVISIDNNGSNNTYSYILPAFHQILLAREDAMLDAAAATARSASKDNHSQTVEIETVTTAVKDKVIIKKNPSVLILAPTGELVMQIRSDAKKLSSISGVSTMPILGGINKKVQVERLQKGADVVIATPGRCIDLINTGALDLSQVNYLVLDEVDRMLHSGLKPQIIELMSKVAVNKQSLFFSSALSYEVRTLASECLVDSVYVNVDEDVHKEITQQIIVIKDHEKEAQLIRLLAWIKSATAIQKEDGEPVAGDMPKTIIFANTALDCDRLSLALIKLGYQAGSLHVDMSREERIDIVNDFGRSKLKVLVSDDISSEYIGAKDITTVVNYDYPTGKASIDCYLRRIGFTANSSSSSSISSDISNSSNHSSNNNDSSSSSSSSSSGGSDITTTESIDSSSDRIYSSGNYDSDKRNIAYTFFTPTDGSYGRTALLLMDILERNEQFIPSLLFDMTVKGEQPTKEAQALLDAKKKKEEKKPIIKVVRKISKNRDKAAVNLKKKATLRIKKKEKFLAKNAAEDVLKSSSIRSIMKASEGKVIKNVMGNRKENIGTRDKGQYESSHRKNIGGRKVSQKAGGNIGFTAYKPRNSQKPIGADDYE